MSYIGSKPANKAIVASDLDPAVITGQTALAVAPADTDEFLISDGGVLKRLDASLIGGGKVLQVVNTNFTDRVSSTSATPADVSGFSATITPSLTSSKILVMVTVFFGGSNSSYAYTLCQRQISGGATTSIGLGTGASGSQTDMICRKKNRCYSRLWRIFNKIFVRYT
jgi:hypothetical protein